MPSFSDSYSAVVTSAVAIRLLEGTTSVSTADPPTPLFSIRVTCAPRCVATEAAS